MKACFMGLGYIGLPTAIIAAKHGGGDRRRGYQRPGGGGYQPREIAYHRAGYGGYVAGGTGLRTFQGLHRASGERRLFHGGTHSFQGGS